MLLAMVFCMGMAANAFRFHYRVEDAFWRTLMAPFEGTVWSAHFSEAAFSKVEVGMASALVNELLGEPLRKECDEKECFWIYTWHDSGTADFDQRWIVFNGAEKVIEIRKSFFID